MSLANLGLSIEAERAKAQAAREERERGLAIETVKRIEQEIRP